MISFNARRHRKSGTIMREFAEILETIAHGPVRKRAVTNLGVLNEALGARQAELVFTRHAHRPEWIDDPAHFRHCFD